MELFHIPPFHFHHSKWSDWYVGSSSSSSVSVGTPEAKLAVESMSIRIPFTEMKEGRVTRSFTLKGNGVGLGVGIQLATPYVTASWSPKNLPGSKMQTPGVGSRLRYSIFSPDPMQPPDFEGLCAVFSVSGVMDGLQTSGLMLIFMAGPSIASVSPTSLWGLGFSAGYSVASILGGVGADSVLFNMKLG